MVVDLVCFMSSEENFVSEIAWHREESGLIQKSMAEMTMRLAECHKCALLWCNVSYC
jgi:hypothetical protein